MFNRKERKAIFKEIGESIFFCRKKRGLTQKQLAERVNQQRFKSKISNKEISRYEKGSGMRSIMFFRICVALKISTDELYNVQFANIENIKVVTFESIKFKDNQQTTLEDELKKRLVTNINKWMGDREWKISDLCKHYTEEAYEMNLWDADMSATDTVLRRYMLKGEEDTLPTHLRDIDLISLIILASVFNKELSSFLDN